MSIAIANRITKLEEQVAELLELVRNGEPAPDLQKESPVNRFRPRQMCPHCHEKPNYYLHVRACAKRHGKA